MLGDTPLLSPEDYFGWSVCGTTNPYIIFLFNGNYSIVDLIAKLWNKDSSGLEVNYNAYKAFDQFGNELKFDGNQVFNVSFLRLEFSFPSESMLLLLSEVSIASESRENVITGTNLTQLLAQKYNDTNGNNNKTNISTVPISTSSMIPTGKNTTIEGLIFKITTGVLSCIVVLLLIIISVLVLVLISCYRANKQSSSSQFYTGNENDNNSNGREQTDGVTIDSIKSNDARVGGDNLELSESQVYL